MNQRITVQRGDGTIEEYRYVGEYTHESSGHQPADRSHWYDCPTTGNIVVVDAAKQTVRIFTPQTSCEVSIAALQYALMTEGFPVTDEIEEEHMKPLVNAPQWGPDVMERGKTTPPMEFNRLKAVHDEDPEQSTRQ